MQDRYCIISYGSTLCILQSILYMVLLACPTFLNFHFRPADLILSGDPYLEYAAQISLSALPFGFPTILALHCSSAGPRTTYPGPDDRTLITVPLPASCIVLHGRMSCFFCPPLPAAPTPTKYSLQRAPYYLLLMLIPIAHSYVLYTCSYYIFFPRTLTIWYTRQRYHYF
jgi:hypothetical protein